MEKDAVKVKGGEREVGIGRELVAEANARIRVLHACVAWRKVNVANNDAVQRVDDQLRQAIDEWLALTSYERTPHE